MHISTRRVNGWIWTAALMGSVTLAVSAPAFRGGGGDSGSGGNGGGRGRAQRVRRDFRLFATAAGAATMTRGKARIESRPDRDRQKFEVEVESRGLAAGTVLRVTVLNPAAGTVEFTAGELTLAPVPRRPGQVRAELELESENAALPAGLTPVTEITEIHVSRADTGDLLLSSRRP